MKNNDKNNLNDKELENISGGDIGNKMKFDKEKITDMKYYVLAYGGPDPRRRWEILEREMEEKRKKQDEKEGAESLLPATPEKENK